MCCDAAQATDSELAADDDYHHPGRRNLQLHERDQRRGDEELVRNRIQHASKRGDLLAPAGKITVQQVRECSGEKQACAPIGPVVDLPGQQDHHHEGNQKDPG